MKPETLALLLKARPASELWVLTGDKYETAELTELRSGFTLGMRQRHESSEFDAPLTPWYDFVIWETQDDTMSELMEGFSQAGAIALMKALVAKTGAVDTIACRELE